MSRTYSAAGTAHLTARESQDSLVTLITVTGTGIASPIRICDRAVTRLSEGADAYVMGLSSRGNNYTYLQFDIVLPSDSASESPRATLIFTGVTKYMTPTIAEMDSPPYDVLVEQVLLSDPDTLEEDFQGLVVGSVSYDAVAVSFELTFDAMMNESVMAWSFTPSYAPGGFS